MKLLSGAFKEIAIVTHTLMVNSVIKVVDEANNINVTDTSYIKEFLQNIDKKSVDQIADLIKQINQIGIKKTFTAICEECEYNWESEVDFNPVNFS